MLLEGETRRFISALGLKHAVAGFLGAARLGDDDGKRAVQGTIQAGDHPIHAIWIGIIEEIGLQLILAALTQGMGDKLWAEGRTTNADHQKILEPTSLALNGTLMNFLSEGLDLREGLLDLISFFRGRGQTGVAQPVVTYLAPLIRIGHSPTLQGFHFFQGIGGQWFESFQILVDKGHLADVHTQTQ